MSIKDKIENAREDDWLTKDLSEEELNKIKEEVNREKAIEVLQSHKSHWERLLRDKICDKTEGTDFINAVDMAIKALKQTDGDLISRQAVIDNIKTRLWQTALNNDEYITSYAKVCEDIAENRIDTWVNEVPSAKMKGEEEE